MTSRPAPRRAAALLTVLLLALCAAGCRVVQGVADAPGAIVDAASGKKQGQPAIDLAQVRQHVVQLADRVTQQVDTACLLFTARVDTQEAQEQALRWRISAAERAYAAVTSPLPVAALTDLVALATYEARVHETYWTERFGADDAPLVEAWQLLAEDGMAAAERCLPAEHVASLREVLDAWKAGATDQQALVRAGAPNVADLARQREESSGRTSLLGAVGLDPLDSIEPAAREVARARELAERGLFLAQRAPRLLALRVELLALQLTKQPDVQVVLQGVDRASRAADSVAATAEGLPEKLRVEGDALIQRTSAELTAQRAGIVADLERTSAPTQELLVQARQTLEAATQLAQALDTTTRTVDTFVAHVAPPEPAGAAPAPEEPPGKPFDPVEYTALAAQITAGLHELNSATASLDRSLPAVRQAADDAAARVDRSIERAYGLALRLVAVVAAAVLGVALLLRVLPRRARAQAPS